MSPMPDAVLKLTPDTEAIKLALAAIAAVNPDVLAS